MQIKFGNKVRVGDPCYEPGNVSKDAYAEFPVVAGIWDCYVDGEGEIAAVGLKASKSDKIVSSRSFDLGVDSGQMAFEPIEVVRGGEYEEEGYYGDACRMTLAKSGHGVFQSNGYDVFVSSTGHGDGCYRLKVDLNEAGEAVEMSMVFIEEEEEVCERCGDAVDWCCCDDEDEE